MPSASRKIAIAAVGSVAIAILCVGVTFTENDRARTRGPTFNRDYPIGTRITPSQFSIGMIDDPSSGRACTILPGATATYVGPYTPDGKPPTTAAKVLGAISLNIGGVRIEKAKGTCREGDTVYVITPYENRLSTIRYWKDANAKPDAPT